MVEQHYMEIIRIRLYTNKSPELLAGRPKQVHWYSLYANEWDRSSITMIAYFYTDFAHLSFLLPCWICKLYPTPLYSNKNAFNLICIWSKPCRILTSQNSYALRVTQMSTSLACSELVNSNWLLIRWIFINVKDVTKEVSLIQLNENMGHLV